MAPLAGPPSQAGGQGAGGHPRAAGVYRPQKAVTDGHPMEFPGRPDRQWVPVGDLTDLVTRDNNTVRIRTFDGLPSFALI